MSCPKSEAWELFLLPPPPPPAGRVDFSAGRASSEQEEPVLSSKMSALKTPEDLMLRVLEVIEAHELLRQSCFPRHRTTVESGAVSQELFCLKSTETRMFIRDGYAASQDDVSFSSIIRRRFVSIVSTAQLVYLT